MNIMNVLMAHMHHVVDSEANKDYHTDGLGNAHAPSKEEDARHQCRHYKDYWQDRKDTNIQIISGYQEYQKGK